MFKCNINHNRRVRLGLILALWACALAPLPAAAAEKAPPPVRIDADRAQLDDRAGVSVYTGDVRVVRGALTITGERLVITRQDGAGNAFEAEMTGSPAHLYHDVTEQVQRPVTGTAQTINYLTAERLVRLEGDAELHQGRDEVRGEVIRYDVTADKIIADAGDRDGERVHIVIHPEERENP